MNKEELKKQLEERYASFVSYINALSEADFLFSFNNEKWTAGQQLEHIYKSVKPVTLAFGLPHWLMRLIFGKANRTSRSYEGLVSKYQKKLAEGGKSTKQFLPARVAFSQKQALINQLQKTVARLITLTDHLSEADLDTLLLPHPLLGKLTFREMLLFSIYHVQHHQKLTVDYLAKK